MGYDLKSHVFTAPNGKKMTFHYRDNTNDWNVITAAFVEDEYGVSKLSFEKDDVVVDIGAHIGAVTLLLATMHPNLKIFAYEPVLDNFELLRRNVEENNLTSEMNIFNEAVWFYNDDYVKMYYGDNSPSGIVHKFIGSQFVWGDCQNVRVFTKAHTVSLSKIFEEERITKCKFIKMDCEGAEYGIFKGCPKEVLEMIERIHGEWHAIDFDGVKGSRQLLLEQTKGVFRDETSDPGSKHGGPFIFVRK